MLDAALIGMLDRIGRLERAVERLGPAEAPLYVSPAVWLGTANGGASAMDFASISQEYRSLALTLSSRNTVAAANILCQLSAGSGIDSGNNYDWQYMSGSGATAGAGESFATNGILAGAHGIAAGAMSPSWMAFPDYANTTDHKTVIVTYGRKIGTASGELNTVTVIGHWRNAGAIHDIRLLPILNAFASASRATLYGLP